MEEQEKRNKVLVETPIDEVELTLGLLRIEHPKLLIEKSYKDISNSLNDIYKINSSEADIFLLYEPTIEEVEEDMRTHYKAMGLTF